MEVYFYDIVLLRLVPFFFFKHKTAYDMRIIDGSSDLCSSDLYFHDEESAGENEGEHQHPAVRIFAVIMRRRCRNIGLAGRSEEHTSELQSLMRISYAVFCLKKKKTTHKKAYRTHAIKRKKYSNYRVNRS